MKCDHPAPGKCPGITKNKEAQEMKNTNIPPPNTLLLSMGTAVSLHP
jgi:hypothetical protein